MTQPPCDHRAFESKIIVHRMIEDDGTPTGKYAVAVNVRCEACGMPLQFVGMPVGVHPEGPTISATGEQARLNAVEEGAQP